MIKENEIRDRLGLEPGPTLLALARLAEKTAPKSPWSAFGPLWLSLPWLEPGCTPEKMHHLTPRNVHPFAETGGDQNHFGFLLDADVPTEERPIVLVVPKDDDDACQIVASNLKDFLGLIAVAFGEVVSRTASDQEWFAFRKEWYGDQPKRLREMERLSELLCTIPGVARPSQPSKVANAHPDQAFRLDVDDEEAAGPVKPAATDRVPDARACNSFAVRALAEGRFDEAVHHAAHAKQHPAYRPRALAIEIQALWKLGAKAEATASLEKLLHGWLDPAPVPRPGLHPRLAIEPEELKRLVQLVKGGKAGPLIEQIDSAPRLVESSGDFF